MGTKMAVAFANIFMGKVEKELLNRSAFKPLVWKRYIDDIFSLWDISREELQQFIEQANNHHPTIKFTAEISETEITFLDTVVYKGNRFITESVIDVRTHYKATETFQYTHFSSCHPPGVKRVSSKERPSDFSGQTQQKQHLRKKSNISNHGLSRGAIQKI